MLPNHAPLIIAEQFGTLDALFPGRVDLGLGRAPGTDQAAARAMRRIAMSHLQPSRSISLAGVAATLAERMISIFTPDANGYRPVNGPRGTRKAELFAHDPHWRELVLFYEYFHGETGEGLGASHQTGWTGLVANLIDEWRRH